MTGFVRATFVNALDSETITKAAFTAFFITHGLPKLIIIDAGNEFAGTLKATCNGVGIPFYTVSRGNHKAILCERFHRYLNKVQRIHATNCETFQEFAFGTVFAVYAWNAAPVDGTNITRSYAAIGREFPFPIDLEREPLVPREHHSQGEQTLQHITTAMPLFHKQQELLHYLTEDRREHHRQLKNANRHTQVFYPGDLVIIRKQVMTTQEHGPAKARIRARGPYRVLEELRPGTYNVQRIPSTSGQGRHGRVVKESAARMERIPSPLILHKPSRGIDTRLATYTHAMIDNPLEQTMGIFEHGRYKHAPADSPFAFEKIEDLWQEEIESDSSNSENDDEDGEQLGHGNQPNNAPTIEHDKPATSENTNADTCAQTTDRPGQHVAIGNDPITNSPHRAHKRQTGGRDRRASWV